jgi:hypothetical protein
MITITKEQRLAVKRVFDRHINNATYREFRARVQMGWDCIMVETDTGMWLGIEKDGYTHS